MFEFLQNVVEQHGPHKEDSFFQSQGLKQQDNCRIMHRCCTYSLKANNEKEIEQNTECLFWDDKIKEDSLHRPYTFYMLLQIICLNFRLGYNYLKNCCLLNICAMNDRYLICRLNQMLKCNTK